MMVTARSSVPSSERSQLHPCPINRGEEGSAAPLSQCQVPRAAITPPVAGRRRPQSARTTIHRLRPPVLLASLGRRRRRRRGVVVVVVVVIWLRRRLCGLATGLHPDDGQPAVTQPMPLRPTIRLARTRTHMHVTLSGACHLPITLTISFSSAVARQSEGCCWRQRRRRLTASSDSAVSRSRRPAHAAWSAGRGSEAPPAELQCGKSVVLSALASVCPTALPMLSAIAWMLGACDTRPLGAAAAAASY
jgi:hypothetical protein